MSAIVITGLPGTGKTRLAMSLGVALMDAGSSALILHTDVLKVTLRQFYPRELAKAGYSGDFYAKVRLVRPFMEAQVAKAERDRYVIIIEGTLALGFCPPSALYLLLELSDEERQHRIDKKHPSARLELSGLSLEPYRQALETVDTSSLLRLDARLPVEVLVAQILENFCS